MADLIKKIPNPEEIIDLWVGFCNEAFLQSVDPLGSVELTDVQVNEDGPSAYLKTNSRFLYIERKGRGGYVVANADDNFGADRALQTAGQETTNLFPVFLEELNRITRASFGALLQCTDASEEQARTALKKEEGLGYYLALAAVTSTANTYTIEYYFSPDLCFMLEEESKPPAKTAEAPKATSAPPSSASTSASMPPPVLSRDLSSGPPGYAKNIDRIMDIDLGLTVSFGRTRMLLKEVMQLGTGSIIELDRTADDPVDVWVNNKKVAKGEVVIVGGNYGVRITEVEDVKERINTLGN
jgi:flagellar motor switch protein FliN